MKRDAYYFYVNILLLLIVFIGFAPSFYFRPLGNYDSLPYHLIIHGLSCTAWFVVIMIQSYWVFKGQVVQHRKFGSYFSLIAPILVLSGYVVLYHSVQLHHVQYPEITAGMEITKERSFAALIIIGDALQLLLYAAFVWLGYRWRNKIQYHKRAMLIASILICQQALVRIGKFEFFMLGEDPGASGGLYATFVPLLLFGSMIVYDFRKFRKPHKISLAGLIAYVLFVASAFALNVSGIALKGIEWLR